MECLVLRPNHAKTGPMHTNETKDQFLEMRAKGISLARIATDIQVSQRTLVEWNRQLAPDIRALRAVHLEALHEQTLASREADLTSLAKVQANVEAAITERDFSWVDSDKLVRIYLDLRHEIRDLRVADLSPLYENPQTASQPARLPSLNHLLRTSLQLQVSRLRLACRLSSTHQQFSFWAPLVGQTSGLPVRGASGPWAERDAPQISRRKACPTTPK